MHNVSQLLGGAQHVESQVRRDLREKIKQTGTASVFEANLKIYYKGIRIYVSNNRKTKQKSKNKKTKKQNKQKNPSKPMENISYNP